MRAAGGSAVALVLLSLGRVSPAAEKPPTVEARLAALESRVNVEPGRELFARYCAACHGSRGRGDGPGAADLQAPPRDLTSRRFRFRSTTSGELPLATDLELTIRRGLPGSPMPAFDGLFSDEQVEHLVRFVLSLQPPDAVAPPPLSLAPVVPTSPELIREGRALYLLLGCASCHGTTGAGDGPAAATLTDELGRPMRSTNFRRDPFKGGREPRDVVRTLRTGLNGAPMPSYDETLVFGREEVATASLPVDSTAADREVVDAFLQDQPTRAELDRIGGEAAQELRERRLGSLAHYVISLRDRRGFWFHAFVQEPELEPRRLR